MSTDPVNRPGPANAWARVGRVSAAVSRWIGYAALITMTVLIIADVVGRTFLGRSLLVAGELSGYALVALVFGGLAFAESEGKHIIITIVTDRLAPMLQQALLLVVMPAGAAVAAWLTWFTFLPVHQDFELGTTSLAGSGLPVWLPEALIPLGFLLLTVQLTLRTLELWAGFVAAHRG